LHHPGVLLLDEPTTGLDPGARRDLWQYLQMLRDEEHVSVLVTTHLMEEAERCDRLAIMNEGNLVALGTPAELKSEIGGDVVMLDAAHDAGVLAERIRARFHVETTVLENQVRMEREARTALSPKWSRLSRRDRGAFGEQAGARRRFHSPHRTQVLEREKRSRVHSAEDHRR
jgi:ABC-type multidrug transport system ATPase subunit